MLVNFSSLPMVTDEEIAQFARLTGRVSEIQASDLPILTVMKFFCISYI